MSRLKSYSLSLLLASSWLSITALNAQHQENTEASPFAIKIPEWFKISFLNIPEDISEAAENNKRLLLFFHQDGCPYCRALVKVNFSQKNIVDKTQQYFDTIEINMWGDREVVWVDGQTYTEKEFAVFLKIQYTPTLLFFDEQGKDIVRLNGYYPPGKFRATLDYAGQHLENKVSFGEYMKTVDTNAASGTLHDEPFFSKPPFKLTSKNRTTNKPLAVFFEQRHCADCDNLHEVSLKDPRTRNLIEKFEVVQLNFHGKTPVVIPSGANLTESKWASALNIAYTPSVVFFDERGQEVFRMEAYLKTFHVQSAFDYVLRKAYLQQPSFQRFLQARADSLRNLGIKVDIWK